MDFRTPKEIERANKKQRVVSDFKKFKADTGFANYRIISAMAKSGDYGYANRSMYAILKQANAL